MTEIRNRMENTPYVFEGMTSISALLDPGTRTHNDRRITEILYDGSRGDKLRRDLSFLNRTSREYGFRMTQVNAERLDELAQGTTHGGIVALCSERTFPDLISQPPVTDKDSFFVMLDGIEDPYNFGYTVRSLYAAGVDGVIIPKRNWFGTAAGTVARSSAGTSERMRTFTCDLPDGVTFLKERGFLTVCAGIRDSEDLYGTTFTLPLLLIIGGEKRGISRQVAERADRTVRISYYNEFRGSLCSSATAAIMAFEIRRATEKSRNTRDP